MSKTRGKRRVEEGSVGWMKEVDFIWTIRSLFMGNASARNITWAITLTN